MKRIGMSIFMLFLLYHNAFAYLDPGTGSYVLQVLVAAVAGSFFAIKLSWNNIKKKLKGSKTDDSNN